MSEFTDRFFANEEIEETNGSYGEKTEFTIESVKSEVAKVFGKEEIAMVFHLKAADGTKTTIAQGLNKADGTPRATLFGELRWYNDKPVVATVFTDLLAAIKNQMGEVKYEERKKKCGGANSKFFTGAKFTALVNAGVSKEGNDYYIIKLPAANLVSNWKYLIDKGEFAEYKDIPEVKEYFGLDRKPTNADTAGTDSTISEDDLLF